MREKIGKSGRVNLYYGVGKHEFWYKKLDPFLTRENLEQKFKERRIKILADTLVLLEVGGLCKNLSGIVNTAEHDVALRMRLVIMAHNNIWCVDKKQKRLIATRRWRMNRAGCSPWIFTDDVCCYDRLSVPFPETALLICQTHGVLQFCHLPRLRHS